MSELAKGGSHGLEVISFAECKSLNDVGVPFLSELKYLTKIVMLGCMNIKDEQIK
jgi:hypothetical protein